MRKLFGTDGIRGVANTYPMTPEMILIIGRAAAYKIKNSKKRCKIIIGKDTRLSGYMIETALSAGICSMGVDVHLVGPMPTPAVAYLTTSMRADAGVVISASHNPYQDNGIKFFSKDGFKLADELEYEIEKIIFENKIDELRPTAREVGKAFRVTDAGGRYIVFAKNSFPDEYNLDGFKVVIDCANGAAYKVAPSIFEELDASVVSINANPNGKNINRNCGALYADGLREKVVEEEASVGIALDGDADRVIMCDEKGEIVDGDRIIAINAKYMKEKGTLKNNTVVATVMSNYGLERYLKNCGIDMIRVKVGDRYVVEEMVKGGFNLGGEQSGHIIFLDSNTTGDGIVSALQTLAIMRARNKKLSELASEIEIIPQILINTKVREKKDLEGIPSVKKAIMDAESKLKGTGRVLVRYSGTELTARVMIEGESEDLINKLALEIVQAINKEIGEVHAT
jgi:phosphoglucosamine mutase